MDLRSGIPIDVIICESLWSQIILEQQRFRDICLSRIKIILLFMTTITIKITNFESL